MEEEKKGNRRNQENQNEEEQPVLRPMEVEDIEAISVVEKNSFSMPWSQESFYNELTRNQFAYYVVVEWKGQVVGYGGMWLIMDEAHITNIAIHPKARGRKLGEKLLRHLLQEAKKKGAARCTLEVRQSNEVAQNLYKKMGFYPVGVRPQYYSNDKEDAIIMWVGLENEQN